MAQVRPFQPLAYKEDLFPEIEQLIAPPYDVISASALEALHALHPQNITHLTLPSGEGQNRYEAAGMILNEWVENGTLSRRPAPALYPYTQTFEHPETGDIITRIGFITALKLEPFSNGSVLPHERTLSGPREDRLSLMKTTNANLESIFGMYPDPESASLNLLHSLTSQSEPLIDATDQGGVRHRLWEVTDPNHIAETAGMLEEQIVYIVDGHHRYETALNYRTLQREANPNLPTDHPVDSIMIYLTPMSDPGLVLLPTHRVLHSIPDFTLETLVDGMQPYFEITEQESPEKGFEALKDAADTVSFLLMTGDRSLLARMKQGTDVTELTGSNVPEAVAKLDVSVLHIFLLENLIGVDRAAQEAQTNLRYVKNSADAISAAGDPDTQLVIAMNPPGFEQVEEVAGSGDVMPQKSTYFYPKLASGLLVNQLVPAEETVAGNSAA